MPPKAKFTREDIIAAALGEIEKNGEESFTARTLAAALNSSTRPIFTVFDGMDEIKKEVIAAASKIYDGYVSEGLKQTPAFKGVGTAYIRFAAERPKLFMLLFMREQSGAPSVDSVLPVIDGSADTILQSVISAYGVERDIAHKLYLHSWIYTHGIAVLTATKVCRFSADDVSGMLTDVFSALLTKYKRGEI